MKRYNHLQRAFCISLLAVVLLFPTACAKRPTETVHNIAFTSLGIPSEAKYESGDVARCPWDMIFYNDTLYVGSGDYDQNKGPVTIFGYSAWRGKWSERVTLPEEEINRFTLVDGKLTLPGVDSREDWSFGSYYTLDGDDWQKNRVLPGGIHVFDILSFHGALFAGMGVAPGEYPVVRATEGSRDFVPVVFEKEGAPVNTSIEQLVRTYDLFVFGDTLYATLSIGDALPAYELYRYDGEKARFVFEQDLTETLHRFKYNHLRVTAKAVLDDSLYLVTGRLYETKDMKTFTELKLDGAYLVADLYEADGALYVLTASKEKDESGKFKISVWERKAKNGAGFSELFNFLYDVPPLSLAVDGNDFYLGMGDGNTPNEKNGTVLLVEFVE